MEKEIDAILTRYEHKDLSRRDLIRALITMAGSTLLSPLAIAQQAAPVAVARSMNHVSLSVLDVNRSADFYARVLGMQVISRPANGGLNMGLGSESFLGLYQFQNPGSMHHLCIGVDDYDADSMAQTLTAHEVESSISRDPANRTSGGDQLYFNDPDGIRVQLAQHGYLG